jgi:hypothetical protein
MEDGWGDRRPPVLRQLAENLDRIFFIEFENNYWRKIFYYKSTLNFLIAEK